MISIDKIILPIKNFESSGNPHMAVLFVLYSIEKIPLRATEMRFIQDNLQSFCSCHNFKNEKVILSIMNLRFSFSYIPFVNNFSEITLSLSKSIIDEINSYIRSISIDVVDVVSSSSSVQGFNLETIITDDSEAMSTIRNDSRNKNIHLKTSDSSNSNLQKYFVCNIHRHQSTLWTSYRLYLMDSNKYINIDDYQIITTSFENTSETISNSNNNNKTTNDSEFLLGAKRVKNNMGMGMNIGTCYIWNCSEDSKFWKDKNAIGRISTTKLNSQNTSPRVNLSNTSPRVNSNLVYVGSTSVRSNNNQSDNNLESEVNNTTNVNNEIINNLKESDINILGSPIVLSVNSKGLDKLIQITAIVGNPNNQELTNNNNQDENLLLAELENINSNYQSASAETGKFIFLRSKQPRKISSLNNVHAVEFGKDSRVKEPSRKNVVMDSLFESNGTITTEWLSNSEKPPLLQLGKIDEDTFALDFYNLTPFQAFTIALAAFDQ